LESSRLRIALFKALQVDSHSERQVPLEKIIQVVKSYMRMAKSPFSPAKNSATTAHPSSTTETTHRQQIADDASLTFDTTESPNTATTHPILQTNDDTTASTNSREPGGSDEELQYFLLTMLRLSYTCPFRDVRLAFQQFLKATLVRRGRRMAQSNHVFNILTLLLIGLT
jgi:hypothetical protein